MLMIIIQNFPQTIALSQKLNPFLLIAISKQQAEKSIALTQPMTTHIKIVFIHSLMVNILFMKFKMMVVVH